MNKYCLGLIILSIFLVFSGCNTSDRSMVTQGKMNQVSENGRHQEQDSMTIFCGAANKPAMEEIAKHFRRETGIEINMIFGGSGTLLSQIEFSKKGEIYLPGSPDYIIIGIRKNLLLEGSERKIAYLVPGIITPKGNPANIQSLEDLTKPGMRVGLGNPETVCLGLYAIEILEKNQLLDSVMKNVVTFGASCSKAANLAAMRKVDAIIGWRVFQFWNEDRMTYIPITADSVPRISFISISIPIYTRDRMLSEKFIDFVLSPRGKSMYEKYGYITDEKKARELAPQASIGGEYKLPEKYFNLLKDGVHTR